MSLQTLEAIIKDPRFAEYLAILKGTRNGLVYGAKVRFPHALVMAILFGTGNWKDMSKRIFTQTKNHAVNLASFVTLYKSILLIQRKLNNGKERSADTFLAGVIGGYIVFGDRNAINEQIVLYVCSRVVASFIPRAGASDPNLSLSQVKPIPPDSRLFSFFAAITWGAVMWLFRYRGETLQSGMFNSMVYLYRDSDHWDSLKTLFWHNK